MGVVGGWVGGRLALVPADPRGGADRLPRSGGCGSRARPGGWRGLGDRADAACASILGRPRLSPLTSNLPMPPTLTPPLQEFGAARQFPSGCARIEAAADLRDGLLDEDSGPLAHAPRPAAVGTVENFYSDTIYSKGRCFCRLVCVSFWRGVLGRVGVWSDAIYSKGGGSVLGRVGCTR